MKALTIQQPWASLIAIGAKKIETRSWLTSYRGPLAIHAGKSQKHWSAFDEDLIRIAFADVGITRFDELPFGCIVATCNLMIIRQTQTFTNRTRREDAFGDFFPGRYGWMLDDVSMLTVPVPATGAQGLWEWTGPDGVTAVSR